MNILISGANGQLGSDLVKILSRSYQVFGLSRQEMDITDMQQVLAAVQYIRPDVIIHAAAYTQVDQAETDSDRAYLVNAYGTRNLAAAARQTGAKIVYISTDYVFDGERSSPYHEFDKTNPQTIYGKSKLAGEEFMRMMSPKSYIVRTSWVYGKHGSNFVETMLRLAQQKNDLFVVHDQVGSPTYSVDLVRFIANLISTELYGIYHVSNTGHCTWYEFAQAIFDELKMQVRVHPIRTVEFPRPAPRPRYSVLDHMSIRLNGFQDLRHWRAALHDFLQTEGR